ncbi:putative short-chain dehydrogenase/reductase SDR, NAD(P)-binding domain superfamily [Helianthus annuus]|nr:putative short-chain dehydrogenase/reductase SDR, NAD(P)-binding domain superfamily [Helianthus annuus]
MEGATVAFTYVKGVEDIDANDTLRIINESKVKGSGDPIAIPTDLRYSANCKDVEIRSLQNTGALMSWHALEHMKEGSAIINTTSVLAYTATPPSWLEYISTKGAIVSFTRALALHLVGKKIRVNGVAPGPIWTPLQAAALNDEDIATFGSTVPMDRAGQPYEVAPSYVFLASEQGLFLLTGQVLHPNGNKFSAHMQIYCCSLLKFLVLCLRYCVKIVIVFPFLQAGNRKWLVLVRSLNFIKIME